MSFRKAVQSTPNLNNAWRKGLGALQSPDKKRIRTSDPRRLLGSVDIDTALQAAEPNASRWDYAIGFEPGRPHTPRIYWVEVHPATDGEIPTVLKKLDWLKGWLGNDGSALDRFEREVVWVASGRTAFTQHARQCKRLAQQGIRHAGGHLRLV